MKFLLHLAFGLALSVIQVAAVFTGDVYLRNLTYGIAVLSAVLAGLCILFILAVLIAPESMAKVKGEQPVLPIWLHRSLYVTSLVALVAGGWFWCAAAKAAMLGIGKFYRLLLDDVRQKHGVGAAQPA